MSSTSVIECPAYPVRVAAMRRVGAWAALATAAWCLRGAVAPSALLLLVVLAPWLEETVFRGGLQEALLRRRLPPWAANLAASAAFALLHGLSRSWLLAAWVVLPSLLLGALYARTRRIAPVAWAHAAMNLAWLAMAPLLAGLPFLPTSL